VQRVGNVSHLGECLTPACFLLSRSTKYQASHHKETIDTENTTEVNGDHHSKDSAQTTGAGCEMEINTLPAVSKEPQITAKSDEPCGKDLTGSEELEAPPNSKNYLCWFQVLQVSQRNLCQHPAEVYGKHLPPAA